MGAEIFYRLSNKWFYETVRPSYKSLADSYLAVSRVRYSGTGSVVSDYKVSSDPAYHSRLRYQNLGKYRLASNPSYLVRLSY